MTEPLTEAQYGRRKQRLISMLDPRGDLEVEESEGAATRKLRFLVSAPGHELPVEAIFDYGERFVRAGSRWRIAGYRYEYREQPGPGRLAYHWHDDRFHAHCVDAARSGGDRHFRAHEVTVFEAHGEFAALCARGARVTCAHLRPATSDLAG